MPKKWKGKLEDICAKDNIAYAYRVAKKTTKKRHRKILQLYEKPERQEQLGKEVYDVEHYFPKPSHQFKLVERTCNKVREIEAPHFETKVVEHMIIAVFEQQMIKFLHPYVCASIKNRGIEKARKRVKSFSRLPKKQKKYYVQGDISKFFPSIKKEIALEEYKRHIGDTRIITLIDHLMPHTIGQPLGNALVQFTSNLTLAKFDNECVKWSKNYVRYMDDFVLLFSKKRKAQQFIKYISTWIVDERELTIKQQGSSGIQIWQWEKRPINIAGYKTSFNGSQELRWHTLKRILRLEKLNSYSLHQAKSLLSLSGWVKHSSCKHLYYDIKLKSNKLKHIVSTKDKQNGTLLQSRQKDSQTSDCRGQAVSS